MKFVKLFSIFEFPIIHSVCPQILHKPLFLNAPGSIAFSQEHFKTISYAKFGGQTECIMGNSKIVNGAGKHVQKEQGEKRPFAKTEPVSANCSDDSIQILLRLSWIVTLTIQAYFRRIYMESSEHNVAYISSPFFTNRLIFSK